MTGEEMFESLTGYEEIAISKMFDAEITHLAEAKPTTFMRALIFIARTREGLAAPDAKKAVMEMSLGECNDYFADDEPDVDPDDPVSESGKDDGLPS